MCVPLNTALQMLETSPSAPTPKNFRIIRAAESESVLRSTNADTCSTVLTLRRGSKRSHHRCGKFWTNRLRPACNFLSSCDGSNAMFGSRQMLPSKLCLGILSKNSSSDFALPSVTVVHTQHKWSANGFMESHSTLNYFCDTLITL